MSGPQTGPGTGDDSAGAAGSDASSPEPTDAEIDDAVLGGETIWVTPRRRDAAALRALGVVAMTISGTEKDVLHGADAINYYVPDVTQLGLPPHDDGHHSVALSFIKYTKHPGIAWGPLTSLDGLTVTTPATEPPRATSGPGGTGNGAVPPCHNPLGNGGPVARTDLGKHQDQAEASGGSKDEGQAEPFWRVDETADIRDRIQRLASRLEYEARAKELREYRLSGGVSQRLTFIETTTIKPKKAVADIGYTTAGDALLYRGRVNTIFGQSESAKSWFSLACALDVISRGGRVLVIDLEDDQDGFGTRLELLGIKAAGITYANLISAPTWDERQQISAKAKAVDLIIVDSFDALLALLALDSYAQTPIRTAWLMLKQWAKAGHAALLVVDHATEKEGGSKATTAIGASAKKQTVDGVMLRADRETVWSPAQALCKTLITLGKDRHGSVKQHALFDPTGKDPFGRVARLSMINPIGGGPARLSLGPAPNFDDEPSIAPADLDAIETKIIDEVQSHPDVWHSRTAMRKAGGDENGRGGQDIALARLVAKGEIKSRERTVVNRKVTQYGCGDNLPE